MKNIITLLCFILSTMIAIAQHEMEIRTDGIVVPRITNAQRPASPSIGHLVYNTSQDQFEYYDGSLWVGMSSDGDIPDKIQDADGDTEIILEEGVLSTDPDIIKFNISNSTALRLEKIPGGGGSRIYFPGQLSSFIGGSSGLRSKTTATDNIGIGFNALRNNETADFNVAIGSDALKNMNTSDNTSPFGGKNVAVGYRALENAGQTSTSNVAIGFEAGSTGDVMSNSIFIGNQAGKNALSTDNTLYITNEEGNNPLIYGEFINDLVRINGKLETEDGSIFMRNLGSTDTDQGVKWGEGNNDAIFGLVYDGVGNGASSELHLREYNSTDSDVISFKANGNVKVHNLAGANTAPVLADSDGNLIRNDGLHYVVIPAMDLREQRWNGAIHLMKPHDYRIPARPPTITLSLLTTGGAFAPVELPHGSKIKEVVIRYVDPETPVIDGVLRFQFVKTNISDEDNVTILAEHSSPPGGSDDIETRTFTVLQEEIVDNKNYYYAIVFDYWATIDPLKAGVVLATSVGFEY